jgi:pSer/pThr/pTyr-binding forkhead associated (FHA) protein
VKCKSCGGALDLTSTSCPACGAEAELGRITGILGLVCRACDAYNEPRARTCAACGKPLGATEAAIPAAAVPPQAPAASPAPQAAPEAPAAAPAPGAAVVRAFPRSGAPATRFVPAAALRQPAADEPAHTPIPLTTACPRCGAPASSGTFCARCGQALGARGTQVISQPFQGGRTATQVYGAIVPGKVKLVLERGAGTEGAIFRLVDEATAAGRSAGAVTFPDDPCLAPLHATFLYRNGGLHVRDEGAPGGLYLRLRGLSVPLRPGDHFVVGDRLLRYGGPLPPAPPAPPDGTRRLGSPRPPAPAIVIEEWLEGAVAGRVWVRGGPSVTIGRAGCAVNLGDDPHLSQAHAEVLVDGNGGARLRDLGSSNGTFVRIPPHAERELRDGDYLRMGREVLRVAAA